MARLRKEYDFEGETKALVLHSTPAWLACIHCIACVCAHLHPLLCPLCMMCNQMQLA